MLWLAPSRNGMRGFPAVGSGHGDEEMETKKKRGYVVE